MKKTLVLVLFYSLPLLSHVLAQSHTYCWKIVLFEFCYNTRAGFSADIVKELVTPIGTFSYKHEKAKYDNTISSWQRNNKPKTVYIKQTKILVKIVQGDVIHLFEVNNGKQLDVLLHGTTRLVIKDNMVEVKASVGEEVKMTFKDQVYETAREAAKRPGGLKKSASVTSLYDFMLDKSVILESIFGIMLGDPLEDVVHIMGKPDSIGYIYIKNSNRPNDTTFAGYKYYYLMEMGAYEYDLAYQTFKNQEKWEYSPRTKESIPYYTSVPDLKGLVLNLTPAKEGIYDTSETPNPFVLTQAKINGNVPRLLYQKRKGEKQIDALYDFFQKDIYGDMEVIFPQGDYYPKYGIGRFVCGDCDSDISCLHFIERKKESVNVNRLYRRVFTYFPDPCKNLGTKPLFLLINGVYNPRTYLRQSTFVRKRW